MNRIHLLFILMMTLTVTGIVACSGGSDFSEITPTPVATASPTQQPAADVDVNSGTATSIPDESSGEAETPEDTSSSPATTPTVSGPTSVTISTVSPPVEQPDRTARRADGSLEVIFRVTLPPDTPPNPAILMTGDRPALGSGVVMQPTGADPQTYEGEVVFGHDGTLNYRFELNGGEAFSGPKRVQTDYDGQVVNDRVESWSDTR